jgi:hypothetical protein
MDLASALQHWQLRTWQAAVMFAPNEVLIAAAASLLQNANTCQVW